MTFSSWQDVVSLLEEATGPLTPAQRRLCKLKGQSIPEQTPRIVAAAMLRRQLSSELGLPDSQPVSELAKEWISNLRRRSEPKIVPNTEDEANAWIAYLRLCRRREALVKLKLNQGDIVLTQGGVVGEVSSIGQDGRVYFKGGMGLGAWPDVLSIVARKGDTSPSSLSARVQAQNTSSKRRSSAPWSMAKRSDLSEFATSRAITASDIVSLEAVIDKAQDERPIQKHLQQNPHLLTALLRGTERYCLPQKRLGSDYVPDFIVGDIDSLGIHWLLVELETPRSGIYVKSGVQLDAVTRKGVQQVVDWRDWLSANIAYARERRAKNGLGLFDIREKTRALVLVGRRSLMPTSKDSARIEYRQSNGIEIHTYDWLLESLEGAIRFSGLPALNPHLMRHEE